MQNTLKKYLDAQERDYETALAEVIQGRKRSHWMWYIFPQLLGLGASDISKYYALRNLEEAEAYLQHPVLGKKLIRISEELQKLKSDDAGKIFGSPDDLKLRSSMTLFAMVPNANPVFEAVLQKFFLGVKDIKTLQLLDKV